MDGGRTSNSYAPLKLNHAKSLQDISELKKLRESVGKNILEACLLVDGHEQRDLSKHRDNLRRTRENFSVFQRKLSDATSNPECCPVRRNYWSESCTSFSSGDESSVVGSRCKRPTKRRDFNDFKFRHRSSSDAQSVSSSCSFSPKEHRKSSLWKQIAVPIYEDSVDSGVSLATVSPGFFDHSNSPCVSEDEALRRSRQNIRSRGDRGDIAFESDTNGSVSCERIRYTDSRPRKAQQLKNPVNPFILSHTWRSTPNIVEEGQGDARRCSIFDKVYSSDYVSAVSCKSSSGPKGNGKILRKAKASEWKSLPELATLKNDETEGKKSKEKKKKTRILHLLRRLTKSGEYVVKDDFLKQNQTKKKRGGMNSGRKHLVASGISLPASGSPLGKTIEVIDGKQPQYRVEINLPPNGLYGFYVQQGYRKIKKGIFIGSFVNSQMEKLFSGVLRKGDEVTELNSLSGENLNLKNVLDVLSNARLLNILLLPYSHQKK